MNQESGAHRALWRNAAWMVAIAVASTLVVATPANATQFQKTEGYVDEEHDAFELCGLDVEFVAEFSGQVRIREGKGKQAGAFFLQDNYEVVETFTNPANGKYFTISGNGIFQDIKATRVEGTVFEFVSHDAGQPFALRDMNGKVLLRDRGAIAWTYLFDVEDDNAPGGTWIENLSVRISGPHPGFLLANDEECPLVNELLG